MDIKIYPAKKEVLVKRQWEIVEGLRIELTEGNQTRVETLTLAEATTLQRLLSKVLEAYK